MSIKSLLTDRCDIYHLESEAPTTPTFGVPIEEYQPEHSYGSAADHVAVPSYFAEINQTITQSDPQNKVTEIMRVTFLLDADIRENDKVVFNGVSYKAQIPRKIKKSHIEVKVKRNDSL